ncbi:hypothetical protein FB45DRAFT_476844 [Roridomyces roridus]|uniref:Uncharacterized protein n=1 Tax=Roridomyces roridus TaxID=1738132 RepID=A0AAD7FNT8_9AGAR|nr:hypothetical protein FB45DRAFT_476844 [Roridomyces roridus]
MSSWRVTRLSTRCSQISRPVRRFSTEAPPVRVNSKRAAWIALGVAGTATLAYAGYDAYTKWRNIFPPEVRADLKLGIGAKHKGDLETSAYYKRKAWNTAITRPIEEFNAEPYLKITGIAVDLAGELEDEGDFKEAFAVYRSALDLVRGRPPEQLLSGRERLRAVSLAVKLGQLAPACDIPVQEEEKILVWAVEEMLKLLVDTHAGAPLDFTRLNLPKWLTRTDICVPLQELGDFYSRVGKMEYAVPLYLQGISLLVSDDGVPANMCQGAQLMNNVAELIIRGDPTDEKQQNAEFWAHKALSTLQHARQKTKEPIATCEQALAVALFNAGMLRELAGDPQKARSFFVSASKQSKSYGIEEAAKVAEEAIARVDANAKPP